MLSVGIESGDDRILREVNKPVTVREVREKTGLLDRMGFKIRGFFMLGNLGDTEESMNRTIAFSRKLPLFSANFSVLIPIQGSEIYREVYGGVNHLDGTGEDDNYSVKNVSSFRHPRFTMAELDRFQIRAFREFFLNFHRFFLILDSVNTLEDIRKYTVLCLEILRNLLRLVRSKIKERLSRPGRSGQPPDRKSIIGRRIPPSRPTGD